MKRNCVIVIMLHSIFFSLVVVSCVNSIRGAQNTPNSVISILPEAIKEKIDIPVDVSITHTEDEEKRLLVDAEYVITYENDEVISIDIDSKYYKAYMSGERFRAPERGFFEKSENTENLNLNIDIVNNSNNTISINELCIRVQESKPDSIPLIYICTTESYSNCMYLVNESWFDWKGLTLSYSILRKDESFNGTYKKSKHFNYFDKYIILNLLPDMEEMGYDFDNIIDSFRKIGGKNPVNKTSYENMLVFQGEKYGKEQHDYRSLFEPFEVGVATLYGTLKFDDIDFKVDFIANISLASWGGFGALSYANDSFDIKLKSLGKQYNLRYPYTTVIEPYGTEFIKLSVLGNRSSTHRFFIDIKNDNGLLIRSKDINFHYYYPNN